MARYRIITLVDITRTDAKKSDSNDFKIKQQQNFNSLRQTIELRSNVEWYRDPEKRNGSLPYPFEGKANHWIWEFDVERDDVFLSDTDPAGLLKQDLNNVPVINRLEETIDLDPPAFKTAGEHFNTFVEII
jgi:hypothetical protein